MLIYKAAYTWTPEDNIYLAEVLDFPGTVSFGRTLDEARGNLSLALSDMAETNLLRGEALPVPDPQRTDVDADIEEPLYLLIQTGSHLSRNLSGQAP